MSYEKSVTLHQQDGGMSVRAFAELEGLTLLQAKGLVKRGKVLGARQDARSKHWWIYPPAKLLERPRSRSVCAGLQASVASPDLLAGVVADTGKAGTDSRQSGQYAPRVEAEGIRPPAKPLLTLDDAALPVAERRYEHGTPASCGRPAVYAEARNVCQTLHEAAARQFREGLHYLRLDAHEFAQLYAALSNDRRRVRKLIGKKLLPVGLLRASDTVWQKMQAMCHEGRLL